MLRILLVDDLERDRELLREAFAHRGAAVMEAGSDAEAWEALTRDEGRVSDLLVTDVNLGSGVTGFDVARAARRRQPDLPVVYMTAYDIETRPHVVDNSLTLRKPLRLAEAADRALDFLAGQPSGYGADRPDRSLEA